MALSPSLGCLSQVGVEGTTMFAVGSDETVDRLVTDGQDCICGKGCRDLLGAPLAFYQLDHESQIILVEMGSLTRFASSSIHSVLRWLGAVATIMASTVATNFTADSGGGSTHEAGNFGERPAPLPKPGDDGTFCEGELSVTTH